MRRFGEADKRHIVEEADRLLIASCLAHWGLCRRTRKWVDRFAVVDPASDPGSRFATRLEGIQE